MALSSDTWGCGGVSGAAQKQKCHFERELFQPQWSEVRLNTPLLSRLFAPFASFYGCAKFLKSSHELFGGNGPFCERGTSPGSTFATALESCAISEFETVVKQIREERRRGEERCKNSPLPHTLLQTRQLPTDSGGRRMQLGQPAPEKRSNLAKRPFWHRGRQQPEREREIGEAASRAARAVSQRKNKQ